MSTTDDTTSSASGRPFAVFDIDGTLIRWQLYHAVADELTQEGHLDPAAFAKVKEARMTWKKRASETSFQEYEHLLVQLFDNAITDIEVSDFMQAAHRVVEEYKDQVYTYTRDLIRELRAKNYLLFAISASQVEVVELLANYYGFDDFGGSVYETKDGHFTGKKDILFRERKPEYLKQLVAKHHASWQGSIAVGDSESDIPMLTTVVQPIAFNPTKALFNVARANGWRIVLERKNVIYNVEPKNGSYLLA